MKQISYGSRKLGKNQKDKKTYLIVGLCAILMIMVVGYAAFATQLTINGTAEIGSTWCLGFDNTLGTVTPTTGIVGATAPSGSISYNGNQCGTKSQFGATISATLNQPGDEVNYLLTIVNEGSLPAAISSITVNNQNIVSNTTVGEGNILFTVEMPATMSLAAGASTTMNVKAKFQNETNITGIYTTGEDYSITVSINAQQDNGSGGITQPVSSNYIYRWSNDEWSANQDISSMTEGTDYVTSVSDVTNMNSNGANYYLKHKVEGTTVTESYVCFVSDSEHCLKGGDGGTAYAANVDVLSSQQSWFESQFMKRGKITIYGSCTLDSNASRSTCYGGIFVSVEANSDGYVCVQSSESMDLSEMDICKVYDGGYSYCAENMSTSS